MMRAVEEVVSAAGYRLVVTTTGPDVVDEVALVRGMARGYADGLVISPLRVDDDLIKSIRECDVPVVVAGSVPAKAGVDTVRANSPKGMAAGGRTPAGQGARERIAFVNGPVDTVPGDGPREGLRRRGESVTSLKPAGDGRGGRLHLRRRPGRGQGVSSETEPARTR